MAYQDMAYYDMKYRELGRTGLTVSAVGMGCEGRCPFRVAVREKMKEAARLFGR